MTESQHFSQNINREEKIWAPARRSLPSQKAWKNVDGFSFIELVMAITIMAILVAGTVTVSVRYIAKAKVSSTNSILQGTQTAIDSFYMDTNQYPANLNDLLVAPSDAKISKKWQGPYWTKKNVPQDGWSHELIYKVTKGGAHPYELYSWGANGEGSDAKEHISVWELE